MPAQNTPINPFHNNTEKWEPCPTIDEVVQKCEYTAIDLLTESPGSIQTSLQLILKTRTMNEADYRQRNGIESQPYERKPQIKLHQLQDADLNQTTGEKITDLT